MMNWLSEQLVYFFFELEKECELSNLFDFVNVICCKVQDLDVDEVKMILEFGKYCFKLVVNWNDSLYCVIESDLLIK